MTRILIDTSFSDPEPVRRRKTIAFGFVKLKAAPAAHTEPGRIAEDMSVLGLLVIEDEVESEANLMTQPKG